MNINIKIKISVLILVLFIPTITKAKSNPDLEEHIIVTGTRTAKLLSNSPVLVEVIKGETIAKISQGTLEQALNYIPGVVMKRSAKDGYNIQMQGFGLAPLAAKTMEAMAANAKAQQESNNQQLAEQQKQSEKAEQQVESQKLDKQTTQTIKPDDFITLP